MSTKPVAEQFRVVLYSRPNSATADQPVLQTASSGYNANQDTLLFDSGSYNRPPGPGETVYTNQRAAINAGLSALKAIQIGLGQNCRMDIYGKACGTPPAGNRLSTITPAVTLDTTERTYGQLDVISPGLHDMIRLANSVPTSSGYLIRSTAGPEVPVTQSGILLNAPADPVTSQAG